MKLKSLNKLVRRDNRSIQHKLLTIFSIALVFIIGVNIAMFVNISTMMNSLERIYVSNLNLDELLSSLGEVHNSMTEYLDTKSSWPRRTSIIFRRVI